MGLESTVGNITDIEVASGDGTLIALTKRLRTLLGSSSTIDVSTATPTIYNITLTAANTEYSQALPANCRGFEFQCQTGVTCRWSNVTGKVAAPTAPYMTLQPNAFYSSPPINQGASPSTLYFASASAGSIICLIAWS